MAKKPIYKSLYFQVIVAIIAGILVGYFSPSGTQIINGAEQYVPGLGEQLKPLGDAFIRLIKMIIAPVIFCTVVSGIAGMESMKSVGKTGGIALLYFEIVSTLALLIGLLVINIAKPGVGMNIDPASLDISGISKYV
ncbi:MAG: cation:dicarboxylase symporter family transporter, partial [Acinetobacter sp.]